jgi:ATP-dependent Clp protease ATP-binding subunit ClpX
MKRDALLGGNMPGLMKKTRFCCLCNKVEDEVNRLVSGFSGAVCDECVGGAVRILAAEKRRTEKQDDGNHVEHPGEIITFLDAYVVEQPEAKLAIAVAVYLHNLRTEYFEAGGEVEIGKSNILLIGPTGSGKSFLAQTIARCLKVPFAFMDATKFTEAGYVGDDVEVMFERLLASAGGDVKQAEKGIIYIDEIDKITHRGGGGAAFFRDPRGSGVQHALLQLIEGSIARVPPPGVRRTPTTEMIELDTRNILFICGGAFTGLEEIVQTRQRDGSAIGFTTRLFGRGAPASRIEPEDLVKYGMEGEFVGRLPVIAQLTALSGPDLRRILTEPRHSLMKQYQTLCHLAGHGTELVVTSDALDEIAALALRRKTGARALRSIVDAVLRPVFLELTRLRGDGKKVLKVRIDAVDKVAQYVLES